MTDKMAVLVFFYNGDVTSLNGPVHVLDFLGQSMSRFYG